MRLFVVIIISLASFFCASQGTAQTQSGKKKTAQTPKKSPTKLWKELEKLLRGRASERKAANERLVKEGLKVIQTRNDLKALKAKGVLVRLPPQVSFGTVPEYRALATPATVAYLRELAAQTKVPLTVASAARSIPDQKEIAGGNGNAAPTKGKMLSAHLYGAAVDIKYLYLSVPERVKVAEKLLADKRAGRIQIALERKRQHCFHIVVFGNKSPAPKPPAAKKKSQTKKK